MEANREIRLHIVYFLSRNGKIEQPHLITVHHLNNNDVHLRDFKRWLSELRGREMPESFAWSYKRKYKAGYIWQDLTENDLITPTSGSEYVLKGSLLLSPIKTTEQLKEKEEEEEEEAAAAKSLAASTTLKSSHETFQIEKNISPQPPTQVNEDSKVDTSASASSSSSEEAKRKPVVIKIDCWREEKKRIEMQKRKEIASKENETQLNGVNSKESNVNGARKWASVLRNFLRCRTVETKNSVVRAGSNQSDSTTVEPVAAVFRRSWETKGIRGSMKVGERASSSSSSAMYKPVTQPNCSYMGGHSGLRSCNLI